MTATISKSEVGLRSELAALKAATTKARKVFEFTGDSTTTTFALTYGYKPYAVYEAGLRQRIGAGNDYTLTFDGYVWSVVFAVAPAVVFIDVDAEAI